MRTSLPACLFTTMMLAILSGCQSGGMVWPHWDWWRTASKGPTDSSAVARSATPQLPSLPSASAMPPQPTQTAQAINGAPSNPFGSAGSPGSSSSSSANPPSVNPAATATASYPVTPYPVTPYATPTAGIASAPLTDQARAAAPSGSNYAVPTTNQAAAPPVQQGPYNPEAYGQTGSSAAFPPGTPPAQYGSGPAFRTANASTGTLHSTMPAEGGQTPDASQPVYNGGVVGDRYAAPSAPETQPVPWPGADPRLGGGADADRYPHSTMPQPSAAMPQQTTPDVGAGSPGMPASQPWPGHSTPSAEPAAASPYPSAAPVGNGMTPNGGLPSGDFVPSSSGTGPAAGSGTAGTATGFEPTPWPQSGSSPQNGAQSSAEYPQTTPQRFRPGETSDYLPGQQPSAPPSFAPVEAPSPASGPQTIQPPAGSTQPTSYPRNTLRIGTSPTQTG